MTSPHQTYHRISIHAPTRGATQSGSNSSRFLSNFNPRSREGSDGRRSVLRMHIPDFNPRSREGSDKAAINRYTKAGLISIHAPARGATSLPIPGFRDMRISIHAPARGATVSWKSFPSLSTISIHAPARGATQARSESFWKCRNFNPRSREGSDFFPYALVKMETDFNPRSREGSDDYYFPILANIGISIHAPARGATPISILLSFGGIISIHAPARGATASRRADRRK